MLRIFHTFVLISGFIFGAQFVSADPAPILNDELEVKLDYSRAIDVAAAHGHSFRRFAVIGGHVVRGDFLKPVNVTLRLGGQSYTTSTDLDGRFSYFVYVNSDRFELEVWEEPSDQSFQRLEKADYRRTTIQGSL